MLAPNATVESHLRQKYAQALADSCPENLFNEIALTGSSARGIATENSDIEINIWVDSLPELRYRLHWLKACGVENLIADTDPRPDNSYWIHGIYKNIEIEVGWQTFADLDLALNQIMACQTSDHKTLRLAELILSAQQLRGDRALEKWQAILQNYPSELSYKLLEQALSDWLAEDWLRNRLQADQLKEDIHRVWRLIFALNQQWEINWKYAHHSLSSLTIYPNRIIERLWEIQQSDTRPAIIAMLDLIADTLELIKTNFGDSEALSRNIKYYHLLKNT